MAKRARGWWYPLIFVGAFVVVFAVNGALLYYATSSFSGLVTKSEWVNGNDYGQVIAEQQAQNKLGWRVRFDAPLVRGAAVVAAAERAKRERTEQVRAKVVPLKNYRYGAHISVVFLDRQGKPLNGLTVKADVMRPVVEGYDQKVTLKPAGQGGYGRVVALPMPGQWMVKVVASRGGQVYRLRRRFLVE